MPQKDSDQEVQARGFCPLCRSRCGAIYTISDNRLVSVAPDRDHPTGGALCAKGRAAPELAHHADRMLVPMRRTNPKGSADPGWQPIAFDEALDEIAARMAMIRRDSGAEAVAFAVTTPSGTAISDSIDWIQRLAWQFGTPNVLASVEVCNFQKDYAQALTFGQPLGAPDYASADTIVLWGHNPARTWLAQAQIIAEARRKGATVVVIDPKRAGSGENADLWLRVRPGTDAILAMGAIRYMIDGRHYAEDFVRDWTDATLLVDRHSGARLRCGAIGICPADAFVAIDQSGRPVAIDAQFPGRTEASTDLFYTGRLIDALGQSRECATAFALLKEASAPWTLARVATFTGIPVKQLIAFYDLCAHTQRLAYYHWTGTAQGAEASQATRAISSLFALRDDVDRIGGNRWFVGPPIQPIADPTLLPPVQQSRALGLKDLPLGPPRWGYITARDLCRAIEDAEPYHVRALLAFGSNILATHPDAPRTRRALEALEFQVHCDLFMTPMAETADIILPVTAPWEHDALRVGFEISERAAAHIQFRAAMVPPPGEARPDYAIARNLGERLQPGDPFWTGSIEHVMDQILAPVGLDVTDLRRNPQGLGVDVAQVERRYATKDAQGLPVGFETPSRRIELYSEQMHAFGYPPVAGATIPTPPDPAFPILLTTAKSGYYTHSSLRNVASLRRRSPDPAVAISRPLATKLGLVEQDWARVRTPLGSVRLRIRIDPDLADDVAVAEYGWWQGSNELGRGDYPIAGPDSANINAIISDALRDPLSGSPSLRHISCAIVRDEEGSRGNWSGERSFTVTQKMLLGTDVMLIVLSPQDGELLPVFLPGQHISMRIPGHDGLRFYSLTSDGKPSNSWQIAVRRHAGDPIPPRFSCSRMLHENVAVGSTLQLTAPAGSFVIPIGIRRPILCIAGGIGITPFVAAYHALRGNARRSDIMLHYVASSFEHAVFAEELHEIAAERNDTGFNLWLRRGAMPSAPYVRDGSDMQSLLAEFDDALLARRPLVYICGPVPMMDWLRASLVARGVHNADIISEVFKSTVEFSAEIMPARISLQRSGESFLWTPGAGSILDAAAAAGIDLPSGCRVGQCESCALKVVFGRYLSQANSELSTDLCLTCQSVPLEDMVLDA